MKRKLAFIFLTIALVATIFVACDKENEKTPSPTNEEEKEVVKVEEPKVASIEDTTKVFVTPEYVQQVIDGDIIGGEDYVIIEASWGEADVNEVYQATHIPGAVHMNTDDIEEPEYWNIRPADEIAATMKKYGITKDTLVIIYGGDSGAARAAFVCLWAGVDQVKLLDGGLKAWMAADYPTEKGINKPLATTDDFGLTIPAHPEYVIAMPEEAQAALDNNENFRLLSIRTLDEFLGKTSGYSYIEEAGEPAGALWGHDEFDYMKEDGSFVDIETAAALWQEQGITEDHDTAFYCGTGWRATIPFLIAYENNWGNVQLFDGGWFAWQMDDSNPVQTLTPEEAAAKYQ